MLNPEEHKAQSISDDGHIYKLNCPDKVYEDNIKHSIRLQLPQVWPKEDQDITIGLVGGSPSLNDQIEDIKKKYDEGMKFVSMNGTHDFLLEHGIRPSVHIMVDGRDLNARFVKNWQEGTKYLIASQCHADVFEALKEAETYIFHCMTNVVDCPRILDDYYMGNYWLLRGGSTVMMRSITMMRVLGFKSMELFGFDSCVMSDQHHAYEQPENDVGPALEVEADGKKFICYTWMASQANDFIEMVKNVGDSFELLVHGNGLIASMLNEASKRNEVN